VRAALDWLDRQFHLPILFAGFSFGAYVGLRACCGDARVQGLIALGLPVRAEGRTYDYDFLRNCAQPKLFISGTRDQYGPQAGVEAAVAPAHEPKDLVWIEDADHFFVAQSAARSFDSADSPLCGESAPLRMTGLAGVKCEESAAVRMTGLSDVKCGMGISRLLPRVQRAFERGLELAPAPRWGSALLPCPQ